MQPHPEKWPHTPGSFCLPLLGSQEAFRPNASAHGESTLWRTLGGSITQTLFILTGAHSYHVVCVPTALQTSSVQTEGWLFCTLQGWTPLQIGNVTLKGGTGNSDPGSGMDMAGLGVLLFQGGGDGVCVAALVALDGTGGRGPCFTLPSEATFI